MVSAPLISIFLWLIDTAAGDRSGFNAAISSYASGAATAVQRYMLLFMFSSLFGAFIRDAGIASAMSASFYHVIERAPKRWQKVLAVSVVPLVNAILTYAGVSIFVVVFVVAAIAKDLFERMDVPWHLYSMSIIGSATFTAGLLPGTPSLHNIVPTNYLGTTLTAAPVLSMVLAALSVFLGAGYMVFAVKRTEKKGEGFLPTGEEISKTEFHISQSEIPLNVPLSILPVLSPVLLINVAHLSVELSMLLGCLLLLVLYHRRFTPTLIRQTVVSGMTGGIAPTLSLAVMMGFAGMVMASPGFKPVLHLMSSLDVSPAVRIILLVGTTSFLLGNSNVGIASGLEALGNEYLFNCGLPVQVIHRISSLSGLFGAAPHSSALCNSVTIAKMTHKMSYRHYFVLGIVNTAILEVAAVILIQNGLTY